MRQNEMNSDLIPIFRIVNYSFNAGNICSKIGQIVTGFWQIFQQLSEQFIILIAKLCKSLQHLNRMFTNEDSKIQC